MSIQVKLKDIMEEMQMQFEESRSFLNSKTAEIVIVTAQDLEAAEDEEPFDDLPEWERENRMLAMDIVDNFEHYIELPTNYDVNEYKIMENFCLTVSDSRLRGSLSTVIKGKGAFRRFKDKILEYGIEDEWYSYQDDCFKQIAIEWCRKNKIDFIE